MIVIKANSDHYYKIAACYRSLREYEYNTKNFRKWLEEHGARVQTEHNDLICDSLGIVPSKDQIVFDDERDYTLFALRWL